MYDLPSCEVYCDYPSDGVGTGADTRGTCGIYDIPSWTPVYYGYWTMELLKGAGGGSYCILSILFKIEFA